MRSVFIALACSCMLGSTLVVTGCGGASCDSPHCNADPKPNDQLINTCKSIQQTKCSDQFNSWANCVDDHTKCDPATKQTDPPSKLDAYKACQPKYDAMQTCCTTYSLTNCPTAR